MYRLLDNIPEKCKYRIHYCRHGQSYANIGYDILNTPLSEEGRRQASLLTGEYDVVLVSPLRRCQETLALSGIKYKKKYTVDLLREICHSRADSFDENWVKEEWGDFRNRVWKFHCLFERILKGEEVEELGDVMGDLDLDDGVKCGCVNDGCECECWSKVSKMDENGNVNGNEDGDKVKSILIVGHGCFYVMWVVGMSSECPDNARIIDLG